MRFHLPRPLHGWRALAGEIGVIVAGVLIALVAQQLVQEWQDRNDLKEAQQALLIEMRDDNLPQAYTRVALSDCFDSELRAITRAVNEGAHRADINRAASSFVPPIRTWDSQAYDAAVSSAALTHDGPKELMRWASVYALLPMLRAAASDEDQLIGDLAVTDGTSLPLTVEERSQLIRTVHRLQRANFHMNITGQILFRAADKARVHLLANQKVAVLAELYRVYGPCVRDPDKVNDVNANSQVSAAAQRRAPVPRAPPDHGASR